MKQILLSYPRSGNHFVRFIIEYISSLPTHGSVHRITGAIGSDTYICAKQFKNKNLLSHVKIDAPPIIYKYHYIPSETPGKIILILRDYRECITNHKAGKLPLDSSGLAGYMELIKYFDQFRGPKLLIYYEELLTMPNTIIKQIYNFLHLTDDIFLNKFLQDSTLIIQQSKEMIDNKPIADAQQIFPNVKSQKLVAYKIQSGGNLKYHQYRLSQQHVCKAKQYILNNFPTLCNYIKRYFDN